MATEQKLAQGAEVVEQLISFHSQEAKSLAARVRNVENLIGQGHHSPTEGYHCELLIKDYLRENLPDRYSVDTGFIRGNPVQRMKGKVLYASPQIDILIHDSYHYSPFYRTGDLVVVTPEAVAGIVEIKKTLTSGSLKDALHNLAKARILLQQRVFTTEVVFSGIFSYTSDRLSVKSKTIRNRLSEIIKLGGVLPNSIVCLEDFFVDISWNGKEAHYNVSHFEATNKDGNAVDAKLLSLQYLMSEVYSVQRLTYGRVPRFASPIGHRPVKTYTLAPAEIEPEDEDGAEQAGAQDGDSAGVPSTAVT